MDVSRLSVAICGALLALVPLIQSCGGGPAEVGGSKVSLQGSAPTQPSSAGSKQVPTKGAPTQTSQQASPCFRTPAAAVRGYLDHLDRGEMELALASLEHPRAPVWPGVGIVESLLGSKLSGDLVHVRDIRVDPPRALGAETLCLADAEVSPGKDVAALGRDLGRPGRWAFAFWVQEQGECWQLVRGGPVDDAARAVLASATAPFQNIRTTLSEEARAGQTYAVTFDLDLPGAGVPQPLGDVVEGITLLLHPRPDVDGYPKGYEEEFSVPNYSRRWPKRVGLGEGMATEGVQIGVPEIPTDLAAGRYRLYLGYRLGSTTLYWPVSELFILGSAVPDRSATMDRTTAIPSAGRTISIAEIQADPGRFKGQRVLILGRGIAVATLPLCPGYVGFDKRVRFTDADGGSIYAVDRLPQGAARTSPSARLFEGLVGWFEGEVGCPGQTRRESFPYLAVERVVEDNR